MTDASIKSQPSLDQHPSDLKLVIAASAAGTAFEWYDFFIYGALASVINKAFFAGVDETTGFFLTLLTFGAGFVFRPLGALIFGHLGDHKGRKSAFLITITLMGLATVGIGLLPGYDQVGILAPLLLVLLRIVQGIALGGEYGGAAIYVAEHAPHGRRGGMTSWIQTSAALGLIAALGVILLTRLAFHQLEQAGHLEPNAFDHFGWRVPFLISLGLLLVSLWMRRRLGESPAFQRVKAETAKIPHAPLKESFGRWSNLKFVLIALFGIMIAQGAVWYTAFFYSQFYLEKLLKVPPEVVNLVMMAATLVSAPLYILFGALSDRLGRKKIMVFGMALGAVFFIPGFAGLTKAISPDLVAAARKAPVILQADPRTCALQFDPLGKAKFTSPCDQLKNLLSINAIPYELQPRPALRTAIVQIGGVSIEAKPIAGLAPADAARVKGDQEAAVKAALAKAGYPRAADPSKIDWLSVSGIFLVFIIAATALYGPQAAALVELFPTRIRYTAMGLPYNIGTGWVGGLMPATAFAIVTQTGDPSKGLWFPVIVAGLATLVAILFLPETSQRDIHALD